MRNTDMTTTKASPGGPTTMGTLAAIFTVVLSAALFAGSHATVKYLTQELHPFVIAFWRTAFAFLPFIPWIARNRVTALRTSRFGLHLIRAFFSAGAIILWFFGLKLMPLADATALSLTGPLFAMMGAALFLGENVGPRRWGALIFGLCGALVIIRPGFETVSLGAIVVLLRGMTQGVNKVMIKSLTRTDDPGTIVAYVMLLMLPFTLVPALFVWQWPTLQALVVLAVAGGLSAMGNITMVRAYKAIDVSLLEPITFTRLIWAALIGYLVFAEFPDYWTWIGGGMIVAATSFIAHREAVLKRAAQKTGT